MKDKDNYIRIVFISMEDSKKVYNLLFSVRTGIAICDKKTCVKGGEVSYCTFNFHDSKIFVKDYTADSEGKIVEYGLEFIADLHASSVDEAVGIAKNEVETIMNLFCLSTLCYGGETELDTIIERNEKESEEDVIFYLNPIKEGRIIHNLCPVDLTLFTEIFTNYDKIDVEDKRRILRAITWLRKGLDDYRLDEFISNWIGIEILSKILRERYTGQINKKDNWAGIKKVINDYLGIDEDEFNKIKQDYREGIVHGYKELNDEFVREVEDYNPKMRNILIACIYRALNMPDHRIRYILTKKVRKWRTYPYKKLEGKIQKTPSFDQLIIAFPKFFSYIKGIGFELSDENKIVAHIDTTSTFRPKGIEIKIEASEDWANGQSGIEKLESKMDFIPKE